MDFQKNKILKTSLYESREINKSDYINSIKVIPSTNPITQPSPDKNFSSERIQLTSNPGGFYKLSVLNTLN